VVAREFLGTPSFVVLPSFSNKGNGVIVAGWRLAQPFATAMSSVILG
jgi:hypothetical protein